jgi:N6-adenosine-specific RNA methylase IME4
MTYSVIYCDPPWDYAGREQHNTTEANKSVKDHYNTMTLQQLKALDVKALADASGCLLFMWTSSPHLPQALELMKAWGFDYKTIAFVWEKQKTNPGYYTMSQVEICIVGKRGTIPKNRGSRNERQFLSEMRGQHSAKPAEIRNRITRMFPQHKKVELFARETTEGWAVWGNEIQNTAVVMPTE